MDNESNSPQLSHSTGTGFTVLVGHTVLQQTQMGNDKCYANPDCESFFCLFGYMCCPSFSTLALPKHMDLNIYLSILVLGSWLDSSMSLLEGDQKNRAKRVRLGPVLPWVPPCQVSWVGWPLLKATLLGGPCHTTVFFKSSNSCLQNEDLYIIHQLVDFPSTSSHLSKQSFIKFSSKYSIKVCNLFSTRILTDQTS